jgi:MFS family permease
MGAQGSLTPTTNRWFRILGVSFIMYVLSFIDRTNIAMATPGIRADLGLSATEIGFATGTFFWGYVVLQIPAGRLSSVWSPKKVILALLVLWSGVSITTALVHTTAELVANRFVLGVTEGGVLTSVLVLISRWFTRAERARANTLFLMAIAVGPMIANPITGLVLTFASWRLMFVLEAIPALLWGIVWWFAIEDSPEKAEWMPKAERTWLIEELRREHAAATKPSGHWMLTLTNPAVLLLALYNFLALMAEWGVIFWLPSVIKDSSKGMPIYVVGFLAALPYLAGAIFMYVVAASSDRNQERKWHMLIMSSLSGVFLILAQFTGGISLWMVLIFLTLSTASFFGRYGPFWTMPTDILPPSVAGIGIGVINGAGNIGGVFGPLMFGYFRQATGSFSLALVMAGVSLILSSIVALPISGRPRKEPSAAIVTNEL